MQPGFNDGVTLQPSDTQPNPLVRIENGIVLTGLAAQRAPSNNEQPFWRGMAAATFIVLLIAGALATILIALPPTPASGQAHIIPTVQPTTTMNVATSTPLPALPTIIQSWGQQAAIRTFSTQISATQIFQATSISPDGTLLLGTLTTSAGQNTQVGFLDSATQIFQSINAPGKIKLMNPQCCFTDGRFLIVTDTVVSGATCAACNVRYSAFDRETKMLRQVAIGSSFGGITNALLDHGWLLLQTGTAGLQMIDLTSTALTPTAFIALNPTDPAPAQLVAFAWPNVIYSAKPNTAQAAPTLRLRDLAANTDIPLTQLAHQIPSGTAYSMVLTNDTLFFAYPQNDTMQVKEWDHVTTGGTTITLLTTYPDSQGALLAANDRLISFTGVYPFAWDRTEAHWVALANTTSLANVTVALAGHFLAVMERPSANAPQHITIYDTAELPTSGAA